MDPFAPKSPRDTRGRLIAAAIQEIERVGLAPLTVRGIAAAAGANLAAVSYHFGSKEALVAAALAESLRNTAEDTDAYLARMADEPLEALSDLLAYYLEGARRYPQLARAHVHELFAAEDDRGAFSAWLAPVLARLVAAVRAAVPALDAPAAGRRVIAALSGAYFPGLFGGLFGSLAALDTAADRQSYSRALAREALSDAERATLPGKGVAARRPASRARLPAEPNVSRQNRRR